MEKLIMYFVATVGVIFLTAGLSVLYAFPLKWCWNYVIPTLFGLQTINWSQVWCLTFIANCLIKSTNTVTEKEG